jgi:hypothetical protein
VFKDDEFLDLHHRIPFIETPKDCLGGKKSHSVVAMDCEMVYSHSPSICHHPHPRTNAECDEKF